MRPPIFALLLTAAAVACSASEPQTTPPAALLSYFDSIAAIHQAHPDTALTRRLHPGPDTLLSIEDTVFERFTGDSMLRRVVAMHQGLMEMRQRFSDRRVVQVGDRSALIAARETVDWTDAGGAHQWRGVLTVALEQRPQGWVIRAYHGAEARH